MKINNLIGIKVAVFIFTFVAFIGIAGKVNTAHAQVVQNLYSNYTLGSWGTTYSMGYRFTPTVNGSVTALWCYTYSSTTSVILWNDSGTTQLGSATVNCTTGWGSTAITPVALTAGVYYRVSQWGANYYFPGPTAPVTSNNITVSEYAYGVAGGVHVFPVNIGANSDIYGIPDITFARAPSVIAESATSITTTQATLTSTVNPNGASTDIYYRWSTSSTLITGAINGPTGLTGTSNISPNSTVLSGLASNTKYYWYTQAANVVGTTFGLGGPAGSFTTLPNPPTGVTVGSPTSSSLTVNWNDITGNAVVQYDVVVCLGAGCNPVASFTNVTSPYVHSDISCGATYRYLVRAVNASGSAESSTVDGTTSACPPSISSPTKTAITASGATLGGNVTSDNGSAITSRGVCVLTTANPTTNCFGAAGTTGIFTVSMGGLSASTLYHYRAFATSASGTSYTTDDTFTTLAANTAPTITFGPFMNYPSGTRTGVNNQWSFSFTATDAQQTGANALSYELRTAAGGAGTLITSGTNTSGTQLNTANLPYNQTGVVEGNQTVYLRVSDGSLWASDTSGTLRRDTVVPNASTTISHTPNPVTISNQYTATFTPSDTLSTLANELTASVFTGANRSGTNLYGVYTTSGTPVTSTTITDTALANGSNTRYINVCDGAVNCSDTSFTVTKTIAPSVTTSPAGSITSSSAILNSTINPNGSSTNITYLWGTTVSVACASQANSLAGPTGLTGISNLSGATTQATLSGRNPSTTYYFCAAATNGIGTTYGTVTSFITLAAVPTVTTPTKTSITSTSATLGGNVTSDGGSAVTGRGVCVGLSANPAIGGNCFSTTGTTGVFTLSATPLTQSTLYNYRAYAVNSAGNSYSANDTFTTSSSLATVNSPVKYNINDTSVVLRADNTSDGGVTITQRGVCVGTSANPINGTGLTGTGACVYDLTNGTTGVFYLTVSGLTPSTNYNFRGVAVNATGTSYSANNTFTTLLPATGCSVPISGDMIVSSACGIPTDGLVYNTTSIIKVLGTDSGTIQMNASLTVNPGNLMVWGPGKQIIRSASASIYNATGSQITQKYICFYDPDGDGVPNDYALTSQGGTATLQASASCAGSYIRSTGINAAFGSFNSAQYDQAPNNPVCFDRPDCTIVN